ncbi:MAG: 16S rRNA (uracil(1498)-N(3))-methyltransferase [Microcystaceae cyanobacterium]
MYRLIIDPQQQQDQKIELTPQQCHYLRGVVRLQNGDRFLSLNGQGKTWLTELQDQSGQILEAIVENKELTHSITLMVALPKGNGFDEIVRCSTELGVTTLIPIISERTLLKPSSHKVERWRKIATEATEQCERQIVPHIEQPIDLKAALNSLNLSYYTAYVGVTRHNAPHLLISLQNQPLTPLLIATGPEGGWTESEIQIMLEEGFTAVSLGNRILRAITAPIMALSLASATLESL